MDKYIHKLHFDFLANQRIMQLVAQIDEFRGRWNAADKRGSRYLKELRRSAAIESIGSSTRIEGASMSDSEVQQLLKDVKITKFATRDEQEVVGYYEVLGLIYDNFADIPLSEDYIKQMHQLLLKHSHKDERHRGGYKTLPNSVVAAYPAGGQRIIFATAEPALVAGEMFDLIEWTNRAWSSKQIHPLIVLALFVYEFLSIHPFQDGNGRLSRLLTTLALLRQGYEFICYVSFESHIENNKKAYYQALMSGQRRRNTPQETLEAWLLFFLGSLKTLTEKLEQKYSIFKGRGSYLNERQKQIKNHIVQHKSVKAADLAAAFADISPNTLKKDVQYLRREGILDRIGAGRGSVYVINREHSL